MERIVPRRNYLGARGWFWGGNFKLERYAYIVHRITGLGMILFVAFHLVETTVFRMQGKDVWDATVAFLKQPVLEAGIYLVSAAFVIHALNGIRLILQEFGFALGKPTRPIYPYKDSLRGKRLFFIIIIVIAVILCLLFLYNFVQGRR